jgi:hypothetical protein
LVSTLREAIADAELLLENPASSDRIQVNAIMQANQLSQQPQALSARQLVDQLVKGMVRDSLYGDGLGRYQAIFPYVPPLRRVADALFSAELQRHVKIGDLGPCGPIDDTRIPVKELEDATVKGPCRNNSRLSTRNMDILPGGAI